MHATLTTVLTCAAAASAAAVVQQPRQETGILAEITAWKAISSCADDANAPDLSFYITNSSVAGCVQLPYVVESIQLAALHQGPYLVSFYTDYDCANVTRGTTVSEVGNCLHSNIGPWASLEITTY
ncbi:hypothetical protein PFICI_07053 [Pestalotiopsis fici W106-1]|uniref:Ecp2 effector protein domain-containing protein n=1 Tax=Pestalotiopsis fici (strain W106-1 / CGMCC3.15140) TaxID=1229662 RepID=W3XA49_PESFW|nr:uncharacterized protein PFICI_07053 [Pestalotiopsis fici W106-1]ETS82051.1 hypothetical protein PFICI_07053 [Pestalotiopsis fici W106-1]